MSYFIFYIEPYVHMNEAENTFIFYNTLNGEKVEVNKNKKYWKYIKNIKNEKNLQMVTLTIKQLCNEELISFVREVRKKFIGDVIEKTEFEKKPINFTYIGKNQRDFHRLISAKIKNLTPGTGIVKYLQTLTLYINNFGMAIPDKSKMLFSNAYKQFHCNIYSTQRVEMGIDVFKNIIDEVRHSLINNINILGGNIFYYSNLSYIINYLNHTTFNKSYFFYYKDILEFSKIQNLEFSQTSFIILYDTSIKNTSLEEVIRLESTLSMNFKHIFIVQENSDFDYYQKFVKYNLKKVLYRPFFNYENLSFFKDNVFVNEEQLLKSCPNMLEIIARKEINEKDFGNLSILPNGDVYTNLFTHSPLEISRQTRYLI